MQTIDFQLRGEFIALDALLKATGIAESGGAAKAMVVRGAVQVDGRDEGRRSAKLRAGQVVCVQIAKLRVRVLAAPAAGAEGGPAHG